MEIDFNKLDADTLPLVLPLLPEKAREIAACIGLPAALALVAEFGGCEVRFVKAPPPGTESEPFSSISRVVGTQAAMDLNIFFGGDEYVYIPLCQAALRAVRNRQIIDDFTTSLVACNSTRVAASEVARRYRISNRTVENIVNGGYVKHKGKK